MNAAERSQLPVASGLVGRPGQRANMLRVSVSSSVKWGALENSAEGTGVQSECDCAYKAFAREQASAQASGPKERPWELPSRGLRVLL